MKNILAVLVFLVGSAAFAETISLQAACLINQDESVSAADAAKAGWTVVREGEGDETFVLTKDITTAKLPFTTELGYLTLKISKTAVLSIGMSVGDQDSGGSATLELPKNGKKLVPFEKLTLQSDAGEYASGAWSYDCKTTVSVK